MVLSNPMVRSRFWYGVRILGLRILVRSMVPKFGPPTGSILTDGPAVNGHHHLEGFFLSYSSVLVKSWLGRFVRVAGIFQVWTEFLFYFWQIIWLTPEVKNSEPGGQFNHQVASHQIIVKSVVVVVSSGASVSKYVRGRVKSSFLMNLLNLISFGIFVRFSH